MEADYWKASGQPSAEQIRFWLMECRTPELLSALRDRFPAQVGTLCQERRLLSQARAGQEEVLFSLLQEEEVREWNLDRTYWVPLRRELEQWRRGAISNTPKF